jgi:F-type H+-transporting ATPase subunit beta
VRAPTSDRDGDDRVGSCSRRPPCVFGQMDEPPGVRLRVALSALTMAEYFRDVQNRTCCCSSTTSSASPRPARRCPPCSAACRRPWATSPPWPTRWASCRSASPRPGGRSITSLQAVYVPADDYTDPAPFTTFTHFDGTTELSRHRRPRHLPGGGPAGVHLDHPRSPRSSAIVTTTWPAACRRSCSATRSCRTSSPSSVSTSCPKRTASRSTGPARSSGSSAQPLYVAEVFTGLPGDPRRWETIESFEQLVNGDLDDLPEQAFLNVGGAEGGRARPTW